MKNTLIILFTVCALLSCKKKNDDITKETLSGKWTTSGYTITLYNSSNTIVSQVVTDAIKTYWTFSDTQISLSTDNYVMPRSADYTLTNTLNTRRLHISTTEIAMYTDWEITEQTDNLIVLSTDVTDKNMLNYGNGQVAARGKIIIRLTKVN
ncbi:hypothetical protein [Pedobacter sp.]|uniref:hypothetical protein n=1 Tax=Pedobacter sp. TaxID=1411316 RepID=UPI003BAD1B58